MSSTAHISYEGSLTGEIRAGSAKWAFDDGTHSLFDFRVRPASRRLWHFARFALLLAVSSMSSAQDPWVLMRQQQSLWRTNTTLQTSSRRRITMREALKMADDIMRRAEEGRLKASEEEAKRGFDWENFT